MSIEEMFEGMHDPAPRYSGAWWRGECPDWCKACQRINEIKEGHNGKQEKSPS
jgi:hypothetical protein